MAEHSLTRQLYLRLTVVVMLSFVVFVAAVLADFSLETLEIERESLLGMAERLRDDPERLAFVRTAAGGLVTAKGVTIRTARGDAVVRPERWAIDVNPALPLRYGEHSVDLGRDLRTDEQLVSVSVAFDGRHVGAPGEVHVLQLARPRTDLKPIIRTFFRVTLHETWWIFALLLLATVAIVRITINRSMRAVRAASRQAVGITPEDIDRRLPLTGLPSEVAPLARTVNGALDRLEQGYRAERAFTASAAHELRTPLSVLTAKIEAMDAGGGREEALAQVDRMARLVGQLLQLARIETWRADPKDELDAAWITREVALEMSPQVVALGGDIELRAPDDGAGWRVNRVLFEIALRNLIENAIRHGSRPPRLRITVDGRGVTVEDAGAGIPEPDRARVFELFWRRDQRASDGAGIGLALVSRIAERLRCRVTIAASDLGGAAVALAPKAAGPDK